MTDSAGARSAQHELATELRAISELLAVCQPRALDLAEATALARSLRARLDGPPGPRWYDQGANRASEQGESRRAYLDVSPVRGELNPIAPPLVIEFDERADGTRIVRGRARLGLAYEGPPRGVHGGWVAALFDDLLGAAQGLTERSGVTGILEVKYRQVTPLHEDLDFEGWIEKESGRRILVRATCRAAGTLTAEARAMFVRVDFDEIHRQMKLR